MLAITAVVLALGAAQSSSLTPDVSRDVLLTDTEAVFLLEPEVVAGPGVKRLAWSPDGTYLLVQRDRFNGPHPFSLIGQGKTPTKMPAGETQFLVYAAPSRKTIANLRLPIGTNIEQVAWLPGTSKSLVMGQVPTENPDGTFGDFRQTVFWVSASGESRMIAQAGDAEYLRLFVSPYKATAAIVRKVFEAEGKGSVAREYMQFVDGEGKPLGKVDTTASVSDLTFTSDGRALTSVGRIKDRKIFFDWYQVKPAQGTMVKLENFTPPAEPKPKPTEFVVNSGNMPSPQPGLPSVPTVFIANRKDMEAKSKSPNVTFVSTDASLGALSPDGKSVAYVHKGVAMVRPLARVPKQLYLDMKNAAERAVAISNAKQAALALIMNAADNDDNLIASGGDWRDKVMPYIKNQDILNAFTYTFGGGNMSSIENPADTPIGYVAGPGGRAVAYADGHVKWEKDKS